MYSFVWVAASKLVLVLIAVEHLGMITDNFVHPLQPLVQHNSTMFLIRSFLVTEFITFCGLWLPRDRLFTWPGCTLTHLIAQGKKSWMNSDTCLFWKGQGVCFPGFIKLGKIWVSIETDFFPPHFRDILFPFNSEGYMYNFVFSWQ